MKNRDTPGYWRQLGATLAGALKGALLGKSSHDARYHFTDSHGYWDRVVAAQRGLPQKDLPEGAPEYEPVHGWTKRQCDEYLSRNADYRLTYDTELKQRRDATASA